MSETFTAPVSTDAQRGWIKAVLGIDLGGQTQTAPLGVVAFAKLRLEWDGAKKVVAADLAKLRQAVEAEYSDDPLLPAIGKIDRVLAHFSAGLGDQLDDLANASDPVSRREAAARALQITTDYETYVMEDPLVDLIEVNPFMEILISGRLSPCLAKVSEALERI